MMTIILAVVATVMMASNPFEGFKYGMSKDETMKLIEKKVEEGVFKKELGNKRFLLMPQHKYKSKKLKKIVILQARFRFVGKELTDIEITPFTGGSMYLGGFSKGKARALQSELRIKFKELGADMEWELDVTQEGFYKVYTPKATLNL